MRTRILPLLGLLSAAFFTSDTSAQCTLTCPENINTVADPGVCGANVTYNVTASDCGTLTYSKPSGSFFPVGTTVVNVSSSSGQSCSFSVTVRDNQAPVVSNVKASPNSLWPPNHKMRDVQVSYTSSDNCAVTGCRLSVTSNEPKNGLGDGNTNVDWEIVSPTLVRLRAERSGTGTGRIYTVTVTCRDAAGNSTSKSTTVTVPHDMGRGNNQKALSAKPVNSGASYFTVQLEGNGSGNKIAMIVTDSHGRVLENRPNAGAANVVHFGHAYRPGVYNVRFVQGSESVTLRLVK